MKHIMTVFYPLISDNGAPTLGIFFTTMTLSIIVTLANLFVGRNVL